MDLSELTKIIFVRIQKLYPVNVSKILGFILLKEPSEQEMVTLAFGPENLLLSKIDEAKTILGFLSPKIPSFSSQSQTFLNPLQATDQCPSPLMQNLSFVPRTYPHSIIEDQSLCNNAQFSLSNEKMDPSTSMGNNKYYQDASFNGGLCLSSRTSRRSASLSETPINACHYFYKGYCKHGANCRYFHGQSSSDGSSQSLCSNFNELQSEEFVFSPKSIEKLEKEIVDLLKSQGGLPISISLLPILYYERYGRIIQTDQYLIEGQQNGKAGFSLTRLLACMKNSICLINRPHGQHSIILAKDAPKYDELQNERSELVMPSSSSHHIYITFQEDSTFSEDDVFDYFKQYGPVNDVRLSTLEKRTYGFVSFLHPEPVRELLMMKNSHFICGSRVLVKTYKDKTKVADRPYVGNNKLPLPYPHQYVDLYPEHLGIPRKTESSRVTKSNIEEQHKMIELERCRLGRINLVQELLDQRISFNYGIEDSKLLGDAKCFSFEDHLASIPIVPNNGLSDDDRTRNMSNNYSHQESRHIELPENPFGFSPSSGSSL